MLDMAVREHETPATEKNTAAIVSYHVASYEASMRSSASISVLVHSVLLSRLSSCLTLFGCVLGRTTGVVMSVSSILLHH